MIPVARIIFPQELRKRRGNPRRMYCSAPKLLKFNQTTGPITSPPIIFVSVSLGTGGTPWVAAGSQQSFSCKFYVEKQLLLVVLNNKNTRQTSRKVNDFLKKIRLLLYSTVNGEDFCDTCWETFAGPGNSRYTPRSPF